METIVLKTDLKVFGVQVTGFPDGIAEAFDQLVEKVGGFNRPFYGISYFKDGKMVYLATALEQSPGEAEENGYRRYSIEKGEHLSTTVYDWRKKTHLIKDVFMDMMKDDNVDKMKPAIEWYKDDHEMVCMLRTKNN